MENAEVIAKTPGLSESNKIYGYSDKLTFKGR